MNSGLSLILVSVFTLSGLFASTGLAQPREKLSLDGVWDFATDLDSRGEIEKWFRPGAKLPVMPLPGYAPTADGRIRVPGIWDTQGYGTATDKVHHNFVGKGWYRRQVEIPRAWAGRRVFLVITGVSRYAKAWIDDRPLGEHVGCLSIQEYDVTAYAVTGKTVTITIQVDSKQRWEVDAMYGTSSLADYMDVAWGGIWGHVFLETRGECWLSDLFVQPNVSDSGCLASVTLNGKADLPDSAKLEVFDKGGWRMAEAIAKIDAGLAAGQTMSVKAALPGAALWTPDTPTLYTARLSLLRGGDVVDAVESRFGMRQFAIDGFRILLNGKPIMLRGYGDDHVYLRQMAMPSDKEFHLAQLRLIRSYGFNHVRNHSAMMPPEYYDACDEVGMIATAEFPICYHIFLPGTGYMWLAHALPGTNPNTAMDTYRREWAASIRRYRNHPSIFCWVRGNELYEPHPQRAEFQQIASRYDPTRFYIDSDSVSLQVLDPKNDRATLDFYTVPFDESTNPIDNPAKFRISRPAKPVISHESGNYITFSRPDLIDQFRDNFKPFWLVTGQARLDELGLHSEADRWAEKSERLYALCHKYNTEAMRSSPFISGYQFWLFQDYWATSNGIVDHAFRPKSIRPEEVLKFNSDVVLLQEGLERTYRGKGRLDVKLRVSNYSSGPLTGELAWEVKIGDRSVARRQTPLDQVPQGEVSDVTRVGLELPDVDSPARLRITAEVKAGEKRFGNDWSSWLYPAVIRPGLPVVPGFADASQVEALRAWSPRPIPAEGPLSDRAVYVVGALGDRRVVDTLERGACVVLLNGAGRAWPSCAITFRPSWWRGTTNNQVNHTGTFVYDHPATRAMAPDGWCDDGWFHLVEGARKCSLEAAPARPRVIIRALPTLEKVVDEALLFEVGVGKGCLIVSGLNHRRAQGRPENEWLIARLVEYAAGLPQPQARWPVSFLLEK
jgi:beta-galactosidase